MAEGGERNGQAPARRRIGFAAAGLVALAAAGLAASWVLLSRWSELTTASLPEADRAFDEAIARSGGGIPYVEIAPEGGVVVHRDQEHAEPPPLRTLQLLAWEPAGGHLLRVSFPFWFVRLKGSGRVNLGTLTTALSRDWRDLDLSISARDLEKRGPGLVLDHRPAGGSRLLLWTE